MKKREELHAFAYGWNNNTLMSFPSCLIWNRFRIFMVVLESYMRFLAVA